MGRRDRWCRDETAQSAVRHHAGLITTGVLPSAVPSCLQRNEYWTTVTSSPPPTHQGPSVETSRLSTHNWRLVRVLMRLASLFQSAAVISRWRCIDCCHSASAATYLEFATALWMVAGPSTVLREGAVDVSANAIMNSDASFLLYSPAEVFHLYTKFLCYHEISHATQLVCGPHWLNKPKHKRPRDR